jgi:hypothetical protein
MDISVIQNVLISIQSIISPPKSDSNRGCRYWDFYTEAANLSGRVERVCERHVKLHVFSTLRLPVSDENVCNGSHVCLRIASMKDVTPPLPIWVDGRVIMFQVKEAKGATVQKTESGDEDVIEAIFDFPATDARGSYVVKARFAQYESHGEQFELGNPKC